MQTGWFGRDPFMGVNKNRYLSNRYNDAMPLLSLVRSHLENGYHAHLAGDLNGAIAAYRQALALAPEDPDALHLLGAATLQLGDAGEALRLLERAAQRQRNNPALLGNLGRAYFECGQYERAREVFRKASRLNPQDPHPLIGTANSLARQGKLDEAESMFQRIVQRFPQEALVWFNLGNVLRDAGRWSEAREKFERAVALAPGMVDARNNLAAALHALQRFGEAETEYRKCIDAAPDHALAQLNLASLLIDVGRFAEAETLCREIAAKNPDAAPVHTFLGAALGHQGRLIDAFTSYRAAAQLAPNDIKALMTYGGAACEAGLIVDGLRAFARCFAAQPELPAAHQVCANALLSEGRMADGWIEYATRPARLQLVEKYGQSRLSSTLPSDIEGKHICVLREQGLGDEIFFLRYAVALKERGAHVTYQASAKIRTLVERVPAFEKVLGEDEPLPPSDADILVGDLPHALSVLPASLLTTPAISYRSCLREYASAIRVFWPPLPQPLALKPLPGRSSALQDALAHAGPPPYLGLTWRAGTTPETQAGTWLLYKNIGITALAAAVRDFPGTFLALQRQPAAGEMETLAAALGHAVHDFTALNEDLESMLALLGLVDEYVGVSNTNMHLRAGVGKTARVLMPAPAEWRWTYGGSESPWFKGFRIYRQSLQGDWGAALAALKRDLNATFGSRSVAPER